MQTSTFEAAEQAAEPADFKDWVKARARSEGFDAVGIASPGAARDAGARARLSEYLLAGFHGDMGWLAANAEKRGDPNMLWPDVQSIIMLGLNYGPAADPLEALAVKSNGVISVYAQGADYHDVMKAKLKAIARDFAVRADVEVKVFVDTAPVMEKPLAQIAGLGWQGKHTNLVSREFGSWLFLGAIFTTAKLPPDKPETDHCGGCRRCLDICPTAAFIAPYRLDARRCISYLTIEHKGQIAREFRRAIGNRIYGCDDCLAICPWNKFAKDSREAKFAPRASAANPPLAELLALDDAAFRERFSGSPIKRTGRDRFIRNCLIAAGNSGEQGLLPDVIALLKDASPIVRGMAVWAVRRLLENKRDVYASLKARYYPSEHNPSVRDEWEAATL